MPNNITKTEKNESFADEWKNSVFKTLEEDTTSRVQKGNLKKIIRPFSAGEQFCPRLAYFYEGREQWHLSTSFNKETEKLDIELVDYRTQQYKIAGEPTISTPKSYSIGTAEHTIATDLAALAADEMLKKHGDLFTQDIKLG